MEGLTIVEGEVTAQGVLNVTVNNAIKTNITCVTAEECPPSGNSRECGDGYCNTIVSSSVPRDDSFSVRGDDEVSNVVVPGLKVGEHVKVALRGDGSVLERGGVLWDSQSRYLKGLFVLPLVQDFVEVMGSASREAGWGLLFLFFGLLCWFLIGFLIVFDKLLVRFVNSLFFVYMFIVVFDFGFYFALFFDRNDTSPLSVLLQYLLLFVPVPFFIILFGINMVILVRWIMTEIKSQK